MDYKRNIAQKVIRFVLYDRKKGGFSSPFAIFFLALSGCGGSGDDDGVNLDDWQTQSKEFYSVTTADLNGDSAIDIVLTDFETRQRISCDYHPGDFDCNIKQASDYYTIVYLQKNLSPGSFMVDTNYLLAGTSHSVKAGDLNQDGIPDLATSQTEEGTVRLFPDDGGVPGSFLDPVDFDATLPARCIAIGDLNGDNLNDMAVAGTELVVLENNPATPGSDFSLRYLAVENASCVAVADINGDNRNDLVVTGADGVGVVLQEQATAVTGNFLPATWYAAGIGAADVAVADLNGDTLPDLAVANSGDMVGSVSVHLQDPQNEGEFIAAMFYPTAPNSIAVSVGDLNNDTLLDIAVANNDPDGGSVSVLMQEFGGNGVFASAVDYAGVDGPDDVAIADLNGDGFDDVVVADSSSLPKGSPYILFQDSSEPGTFFNPTPLP